MRRAWAPLLAALLVALAPAAPAFAALQWYQDYEQGLAAAAHGDWQTALGHFQEAARIRHQPMERVRTYGTHFLFDYDPLFQQARCLAELGRLGESRELLREAEAAAVTEAPALAALRERLEVLAARREAAKADEPGGAPEAGADPGAPAADAVLAVRSTPPGALVRLDGRRVGVTPLAALEVPPGRHRIELRLDGRDSWAEAVDLGPGERLQLDVALAAPPAAAEPAPGRKESEAAVPTAAPVLDRPGGPVPAVPPSPEPPAGVESAESAGLDRAAETKQTPPGSDPDAAAGEPPRPRAADPESPLPPTRRLSGGWGAALAGAGLALAVGLAVAGAATARSRRRRPSRPGDLPGRIGRYRVTGELGRGGMATTYRALRAQDGLAVALKIPHATGDPTYLPRFLREGRLGETLHHPRIVRILEAGEEGGRPFLAMELIPGRTLRAALDEAGGTFPLRHALEIARDVAEALDYAHGKGVVHRDLKPENVMLLPDGTVKVMDFGVARVEGQPGLTTSSFFFGSPVYAAPELVDPPSVDRRADLYSLGVVLFELLEGRPPFHHESLFKLLEMHQREPLPEPQDVPQPLPDEVWLVLRRLLAKDPADRYPAAQELLVDLERLLYELPAGGSAVVPGSSDGKLASSHDSTSASGR